METSKLVQLRLKTDDPVAKQQERGFEQTGMSPLAPPEAWSPPALEELKRDALHPFLATLVAENEAIGRGVDGVETVIQEVRTSGFSRQADHALMHFLEVFDTVFIPHSRKEERVLFPPLRLQLLASGEHSRGGDTVTTAVEVMIDEHGKALQLAAVMLNLVRMATCLPDEASARMVMDTGLREAENLVEHLRLHVFREENILLPLAQRLLSTAELDAMAQAETALPVLEPHDHEHHHEHDHHHEHHHEHHHHPHEGAG